ncbi:hypothetical protein RchiOBHm_Chr1g0374451 [Rosa chinensis]|uniref:Uncharacterized protein n=1 Tax=Rosa chinensis TaxID=74649 RepID=A0A2P6SMC6_ROSCH|nr:hypothetical protein RchiOBHm_Chr1g0374451 [Rosa chinensis]
MQNREIDESAGDFFFPFGMSRSRPDPVPVPFGFGMVGINSQKVPNRPVPSRVLFPGPGPGSPEFRPVPSHAQPYLKLLIWSPIFTVGVLVN